jgi:hypothetical protein
VLDWAVSEVSAIAGGLGVGKVVVVEVMGRFEADIGMGAIVVVTVCAARSLE